MNAATFTGWIRERLSFERLFLLILLVTVILRFYSLDLKLFHHDEAIHAWFSYRLLTEGIYSYDPMYHGPFLYYTTAGIFSLLGDSDLVGRILPALFGTLLVPLLYPIYRLGYLDRKQTLVAALFLAVSPCMVYFSRFLRNDIYIAFFSLALLVALLYYFERGEVRYALLAGAAAGLGMSTKENMPIVLLIFGAFFLYLIWTQKVWLPAHWIRDAAIGGLVVIGIMAVFYSSFGAHPEVLLDGWLKAIEHWTSMHQMQRLGGPPYFYILLFILYEIPILALAAVGVMQFFDVPGAIERLRERRRGEGPAEEGTPWTAAEESPVDTETPTEGAPPIEEIPEVRGLWDRLRRRREGAGPVDRQKEFARFAIFWMLLSLAAYAYIGEKVPWLILHQLLPMIFVATYAMTTRKAAIAVLASIFLIVMTFHVAFTPADINEPIVQVQNSEDLRDVFAGIDAADRVAVASKSYWPLPWYYRGEAASKLIYYSNKVDESTIYSGDFDLVITEGSDTYPALEGYVKETHRLNYWFSYTENKDRLLEYYFFRNGNVGSRSLEVFSRGPAAG
ncbi:MAG: TIGR03663 family protein [Methanomicrobiales archaeon]|nr:TIGR03663 family protein [Methanomicrobiales archaeon]